MSLSKTTDLAGPRGPYSGAPVGVDRELDLLVAKHIFGIVPGQNWDETYDWPPFYSFSVSAAMEIITVLRPDIIEFLWHCDVEGWAITFNDHTSVVRAPADANGLAKAIAISALRYKRVEFEHRR